MPNKQEFTEQINQFFNEGYAIINGTKVPEAKDIPLFNQGTEIDLAILFIDIKESTKIVNGSRRETAAKMYKSFLWGVAQIARMNDGELRSFNGDGVLVVFYGDRKANNAVRSAFQMTWFVKEILKPKIQPRLSLNSQLQSIDFDFGIGIDTGKVLVVRGGMKGDNNNDLVWVGNPANYAVKLSGLAKGNSFSTFITHDVYSKLNDNLKIITSTSPLFKGLPLPPIVEKKPIWEKVILVNAQPKINPPGIVSLLAQSKPLIQSPKAIKCYYKSRCIISIK